VPALEQTVSQLLSAEKRGVSRLLPDRPKSKEALLSAIDVIFLLPDDSGGRHGWSEIGALRDTLRTSIREKFKADYLDVEERRKEYNSMLMLRDQFLPLNHCVNAKTIEKRHTHEGSQPLRQVPTGETDRACNSCIL
jgi:hypothetical protein